MASLVDQIFEQAKLGTAPDPNANPFLQGMQVGQEQQRINLANRQFAMQLAQLPLQMTQQQQANQIQGLQLEQQLRAKQNYIDSTKAFTDLSAKVAPLLQNGQIDEARQAVTATGISNNTLLMDPRYTALDKTLDEMQRRKTDLMYRQMIGEARKTAATAAETKADLPTHYMDLARQAEEEGDTERAAQLKELSTLSLRHQEDIHARIVESQRLNGIREQRLEQSVKNASPIAKAAFATLQSKLRNIENAPRMKTEDRQSASELLLDEYERKFGNQTAPTTAPAPEPTPAPTTPQTKGAPANLHLGAVVIQNGKRYRYQGGATDDPASYVPVK